MKSRTNAAFTLIEMLVVVAIIAVLVSLLLPAIQNAKGNARRTVCSSQVRQVMIAIRMYMEDKKGFLPGGFAPTPSMLSSGARMILANLNSPTTPGNTDVFYDEINYAGVAVLRCPSWEPVVATDRVGMDVNGRFDTLAMTYNYAGGVGTLAGNGHDGSNFWHGWYTYGSARWQEYDDPRQLGPVWNEESRYRTTEAGVITDRMWLPGPFYYPHNWNDEMGTLSLNHIDAKGDAAGGNIGFLDGHVAWRSANIIRERVLSFSLYRPYICY